ncbi:MAG: hypothetical protein AAFW89_07415 [Bacteroidota bacterium]
MKCFLLVIACLLAPGLLLAQFRLSASVKEGYAQNLFRNPDNLVENSDTLSRSALWQNSVYNRIALSGDYTKKWNSGRLKITANWGTNRYHQQPHAHRVTYRARASFRSKYARRKYIEFAPELSRQQQDGIDQNDLIFSTRLSFHQLETPLHLDFYLGNKAWLKTETKYRYKAFDAFNGQQTHYHAWYTEALFKKRWEPSSLTTHAVQVKMKGNYRDQTITRFATESAAQEQRFRQFLTLNLAGSYSLSLAKNAIVLRVPVTVDQFVDFPTNQLDFSEVGAGLGLTWNNKKGSWRVGVERSIRQFHRFQLQNGNRLAYTFWNPEFEFRIPLHPTLSLKMEGRWDIRTSTRDQITTAAYREYSSSFIQSGIVLEL